MIKEFVYALIKYKGDCHKISPEDFSMYTDGVYCAICPAKLLLQCHRNNHRKRYEIAVDFYVKEHGTEDLVELLL